MSIGNIVLDISVAFAGNVCVFYKVLKIKKPISRSCTTLEPCSGNCSSCSILLLYMKKKHIILRRDFHCDSVVELALAPELIH